MSDERFVVIPNTHPGEGYKNWPYCVVDTSNPGQHWVYKLGPFIKKGSLKECTDFAERLNFKHVMHVMTKGTKAETGEAR